MSTPASTRRRRSQVFVEIPTSPLLSTVSRSGVVVDTTPFKAVPVNVDTQHAESPSTSKQLKRKTPDDLQKSIKDASDVQQSRPKKQKLENASDAMPKKPKVKADKALTEGAEASTDPKPPPTNCHQCARTVIQPENLVQCTFKRAKGNRCVHKYCRACLRNRYERDIDEIKSTSPQTLSPAKRAEYADGVEYLFQCPSCSQNCNCRFCQKKRGLPALGNLHLIARKAAKEAAGKDGSLSAAGSSKAKARGVPKEKSASAARRKSKLKPHVLVPPSPYKTGRGKTASAKASVAKRVPAPKPLPKVQWTVLSTPLTFEGAFERINIREFLLRFAHLMDIAKSHLEELEELASDDPYLAPSDDTSEDSDVPSTELVGWISETALRPLLVGLVTLLSKDPSHQDVDEDEEEPTYSISPVFTQAVQQIKSSGANLTKMWAALSTLRSESSLAIPDPLPPPPNARQRSARRAGDVSASVVCTAQLVPIVGALVEAALATEAVRDDFERGVAQEKELAQAARELKAAEKTRWEELKAKEFQEQEKTREKEQKTGSKAAGKPGRGKAKVVDPASSKVTKKSGWKKLSGAHRANLESARPAHEAALAALDHSLVLAWAECVPRVAPLGRDTDGRVYVALTPGVVEREAALDLLEGGSGAVKFGRRRGVVEADERKKMRHWSWFLGVWGKKPEGVDFAKQDEVEDVDGERWWGFWDPAEIAKLAQWHAVKHGFDLAKKRVKDPGDTAVLDVDAVKIPSAKAPRGRPSNVSSATSSRARTADSDSDEWGSEDGDGGRDADDEEDVQMRVDERGEPVPTRRDLRRLARGLKEYAELLEWRVQHATKEGAEKKGEKVATADKGKAVDRAEPITPAAFYG